MPNKPTDPARKILVREAELKREQITSVTEHIRKLEDGLLRARQEISNLANALASINKTISIIDDTEHVGQPWQEPAQGPGRTEGGGRA